MRQGRRDTQNSRYFHDEFAGKVQRPEVASVYPYSIFTGEVTAMARSARRHPMRLIREALGHPLARSVFGSLSGDDLQTLAEADERGELGREVNPILQSADPATTAQARSHPVAKVLQKLTGDQLRQMRAVCPPPGCDH